MLQNALDGLSGNCVSRIAGAAGRNALKNKAAELVFWDGRANQQGLLTESTIVAGGQNRMIKDLNYGANAYVIFVKGHATKNVVLKANFFTLPTKEDQRATLVHELLHFYFNETDVQLARRFGIFDSSKESSAQITSWIKAGCDKSKM